MIERRRYVSQHEFFGYYKAGNRPVVLTGMMDDWPAMQRWTPEYLASVCGNEIVQVMAGRHGDPCYESRSYLRKTDMRFADYVARVVEAVETNDFYMVAQNEFLQRHAARPLYEDLGCFPEYLDNRRDGYVFLWFGPRGTITPLHHDTCDIILAQVRGRKRVTMIAAKQKGLVYNSVGVFSDVDCERPDLARHPLYQQADKFVVDLLSGEALFIPVGWWHHVRALDLSMSVSFTNFHQRG